MSKEINLIKKIKALADKGVGGEKVNAEKKLHALLSKYGLSIEDIEGEKIEYHFFKNKISNPQLLHQIIKSVNSELKSYEMPAKKAKELGFGNHIVSFTECTSSEFVQIELMYDVYNKLYEEELKIFYRAFLAANQLLVKPNENDRKTTKDLSKKELEDYRRSMEMAGNIKIGQIHKRLNTSL